MRRPVLLAVLTAGALCLPWATSADAGAAPAAAGGGRNTEVCSTAPTGFAHCDAVRHDDLTARGALVPNDAPRGYGPADLRAAYKLGGTSARGRTVAVVDAYDHAKAETDLGVYRRRFGLPACTTADGCFRKVDQRGGQRFPRTDTGWAQEISLDLDMVSATCPDCHILLVEGDDNSFTSLAAAVDTAARLGATAISNSYGGTDNGGTPAYDHPGIAITASTGDRGYGLEAPASYRTVVAVGGTSLTRGPSARGWAETAWRGAGSGCSLRNSKPAWQSGATRCTGKASADVSAVADPDTGVAVYDSLQYQGSQGWLVFGGTSAAAPIIASVYALSGRTAGYPASYTWSHTSGLYDVTGGSNGSCTPAVLCKARRGWDGPTGLGAPKGTTGF